MSDGELHAALGLHRGRRALAATLVLAALTIAVLSAVRREPAPHPVEPPATDRVEIASVPAPPTPPPKKVKRRPRPAVAAAPASPPVVTPASTPTPQPIVAQEPPPLPPEEPRAVVPEPEPAPVSSARLAEDVDEPPPPPTEEPGAVEVNEAEAEAAVGNGERIARAIAAAKRAAVRACFEHELKEQPKLTGTVVVELDLAPPTRVDAVRVSDDLNRPTFTRCVTLAMQSVRFTALDEEISVRVPYVLTPSGK